MSVEVNERMWNRAKQVFSERNGSDASTDKDFQVITSIYETLSTQKTLYLITDSTEYDEVEVKGVKNLQLRNERVSSFSFYKGFGIFI